VVGPRDITMPWNEAPKISATPAAARNAKALRRQLTEPEKRLWWHLRHRLPTDRSHFRRQVALGPYVADFCCLSRKLIVEVDGNQHGLDQNRAYDEARTAHLAGQGFRVLRFGNHEIMREIDVVLDTIHAALAGTTPTPAPSPQGGGEGAHASHPEV
jgi:very-short-patch-repair endonuclease